MSHALMAVLPKLHLNRHTARSIVYGPEIYGGLNLPNAYVLQSIGQLNLFLGHLWAHDKTGKLIITSMGQLQLLTRSDIPFFHLPYQKYDKWIEHSWSTSLWQLVSRINFTIKVKRAWHQSLQCKNGNMLMIYFISLKFSPTQLETLNQGFIFKYSLSQTSLLQMAPP